MIALTPPQMRVLREIASREGGKPEAYYTFSGVRGKVLGALLRAGLIERRLYKEDDAEMYRLLATAAGEELVAKNIRKERTG